MNRACQNITDATITVMRRLSLLALCLTPLVHAGDWPTYQGNQRHTGYVPTSADLTQLRESWYTTQKSFHHNSGMAVGYGHVFITTPLGDLRQTLTAYSQATGTAAWQYVAERYDDIHPPALAGGRVYFQAGGYPNTFFRCHDALTGAFVFRSPHGAQSEEYLAPTIVDGIAYMNGGEYGGMYAFNATNGGQQWFANNLPQIDGWTPAVNQTHCFAYMATYSGGLCAVNRATGNLDYVIQDPGAGPEFSGTNMAVAMEGNYCYITNGNRLIKFDVGSQQVAWASTRNFSGQVTIGTDALYSIDQGALTAVDKINGAFLWQAEPSSGYLVGPMIVTDRQLIAQTSTDTVIFDLATRTQVWSHPVTGPMALVDDELYISGTEVVCALSLNPIPHALQGLTLSKPAVAGMNSVFAIVQMNNPAPKDEVISLWDNTQLIATPATAILRRGQRSLNVRVTTVPVAVAATRTIFARFNGVTKSANLQLLPLGPSAMAILGSTTVTGGSSFTTKLVLNGPAPQEGLVVEMTSDSPYAQVPATVVVPPGKGNVYFVTTTSAPPQMVTARIRARVKGVSAGVTVRISSP